MIDLTYVVAENDTESCCDGALRHSGFMGEPQINSFEHSGPMALAEGCETSMNTQLILVSLLICKGERFSVCCAGSFS